MNRYQQTTLRPRGRAPRPGASSPSLGSRAASRRARAWLDGNAGKAAVAAGWLFVVVMLALPKTGDFATAIVVVGFVGSGVLGFGCGWSARDERDAGERRDR